MKSLPLSISADKLAMKTTAAVNGRMDMRGLRDTRVIACVCLVFPADAQEMEPVFPPARTGRASAMWPQGPWGSAAPVTR